MIANQIIGREDTLDRNPGFVNPQDITRVQDRQAMTVTDSQYQLIIDSVDTATGAVKIDPQTQTVDNGQAFEIVQANPMYDWTVENVQAGTGTEPSSPTGSTPATSNWPGMANFTATFMRLSENSKHETWEVRFSIYYVLYPLF